MDRCGDGPEVEEEDMMEQAGRAVESYYEDDNDDNEVCVPFLSTRRFTDVDIHANRPTGRIC